MVERLKKEKWQSGVMRFFYTNEVTFGKFLDHLRMGIGHQKNQPND